MDRLLRKHARGIDEGPHLPHCHGYLINCLPLPLV